MKGQRSLETNVGNRGSREMGQGSFWVMWLVAGACAWDSVPGHGTSVPRASLLKPTSLPSATNGSQGPSLSDSLLCVLAEGHCA